MKCTLSLLFQRPTIDTYDADFNNEEGLKETMHNVHIQRNRKDTLSTMDIKASGLRRDADKK